MWRFAAAILATAALATAEAKEIERPGGRGRLQGPQRALKSFDANKNGRIDGPEVNRLREAFEGAMRESLAHYDLNGDGFLDDPEVARIRTVSRPGTPRSQVGGSGAAPVK